MRGAADCVARQFSQDAACLPLHFAVPRKEGKTRGVGRYELPLQPALGAGRNGRAGTGCLGFEPRELQSGELKKQIGAISRATVTQVVLQYKIVLQNKTAPAPLSDPQLVNHAQKYFINVDLPNAKEEATGGR